MTFKDYLTKYVSPAAFSMFGSTPERELVKFKMSVSSFDCEASRIAYKTQLLSDTCTHSVARDAVKMLGINMNGNAYFVAWLSFNNKDEYLNKTITIESDTVKVSANRN